MRAKGCRHWRIAAELRANRGVMGNEGVDQLQRGYLFLAFMLLEPIQAGIIETIPNCGGKSKAKHQIDLECPAGRGAQKTRTPGTDRHDCSSKRSIGFCMLTIRDLQSLTPAAIAPG